MQPTYCDALLRVQKSYSRALEPVCAECGLTRNELDVLLFLANNPAYCRAADIVEKRNIAKSHVSAAVQSLVTRGYLTREPSPEDRRTVLLSPTAAAQEVIARGRARQQAFYSRILAGLTPEEQALAQRLLAKIGDNILKLEA